MPDLSETIEQAAAEPSSSSADGQSATGRAVPELIAADQYLAAKQAARKRRRGVGLSKIIPPGACDDGGRNPLTPGWC